MTRNFLRVIGLLRFRDYLWMALLMIAVSLGVYGAAGLAEGRWQLPVPVALQEESDVQPAPPLRGADEDARYAALFGADGHMKPTYHDTAIRACRSSMADDPMGRLFSPDKIGPLCECMIDWMEARLADGSLSFADFDGMRERREPPPHLAEDIRHLLRKCSER